LRTPKPLKTKNNNQQNPGGVFEGPGNKQKYKKWGPKNKQNKSKVLAPGYDEIWHEHLGRKKALFFVFFWGVYIFLFTFVDLFFIV